MIMASGKPAEDMQDESDTDTEATASDAEPTSQRMIRLTIHLLRSKVATSGAEAARTASSDVTLPAASNVSRLRRDLALQCGLIPADQTSLDEVPLPRLVWRGHILQDGQTLEAVGLGDGECVYVVPAVGTSTATTATPVRAPSVSVISDEVLSQILAMHGAGAGSSGGDLTDQLINAVGSNSRLRAAFESNPVLAQLLERPQELRLVMGSMQSSRVRQELVRNMDLEMRRIESIPRGFQVLRNHWEEQNRLLEEINEAIEVPSGRSASSQRHLPYPALDQETAASDAYAEQDHVPTSQALPNVWSCESDCTVTPGDREAAHEAAMSEEDAKLLDGKVLPWEAIFDSAALGYLRQDEATQLLMEAMACSAGINLEKEEDSLSWPLLDSNIFPAPASYVGGRAAGEESSSLDAADAASSSAAKDCSGDTDASEKRSAESAAPSSSQAPGQRSSTLSWQIMKDEDAEAMEVLQERAGADSSSSAAEIARATKNAETRWHRELQAMARAGLLDHAANAHALQVCSGNLDRAINHLLT